MNKKKKSDRKPNIIEIMKVNHRDGYSYQNIDAGHLNQRTPYGWKRA